MKIKLDYHISVRQKHRLKVLKKKKGAEENTSKPASNK
jgi:hypothetical protein